jgi:hypothetical protein
MDIAQVVPRLALIGRYPLNDGGRGTRGVVEKLYIFEQHASQMMPLLVQNKTAQFLY